MHSDQVKETILICGGTGFLGQLLRKFLIQKGYTVWVLSRNKRQDYHFEWDPILKKFPLDILPKVDHIINLSGENLMKRWTKEYRRKLIESRTAPTRFIKEILENNEHQVKSVINASGISIYGDRGDVVLTENDEPGTGFLEKLCVSWEYEAEKIRQLGVRTNIIRISPVVHEDNDFIKAQMRFAKFGLLGSFGSGNQYISWIHFEDILRAIHFLIANTNCNSVYNMCSPNPLPQKEVNKALGEQINQSQFVPNVPTQIIKLALGSKSQLVTDSIYAIPQALLDAGFTFKHPKFKDALEHLS